MIPSIIKGMKISLFAVLKKGRKNAQRADIVIVNLLEYNCDITGRELRLLKEEINLANDCERIIVSCPKGYFVAENDEELDDYDREMGSRIESLSKQRAMIWHKRNKRKTLQGSLL